MELIIEGELMRAELVHPLHAEADELVRIVTQSIKTARDSIQNQKSKT